MNSETLYAEELRAAASRADDERARRPLIRTADRLTHEEHLEVDELMLLSVAAIAIQTPDEMFTWGRSVARRHRMLDRAIEVLLESASERWQRKGDHGA